MSRARVPTAASLPEDADERTEDARALGREHQREHVRVDGDELSLAARAADETTDAQLPVDDCDDGRPRRGGLVAHQQVVAAVDAVLVGLDLGTDGDDRSTLEGARELRFRRHGFAS